MTDTRENAHNCVMLSKYCDDTGITKDAIRGKIRRGCWLEGVHFYRDDDRKIWIDIAGVEQWIKSGACEQSTTASNLEPASGAKGTQSSSTSRGTKLTVLQPVV